MNPKLLIFGIVFLIIGYGIVNFIKNHGLLDFVSIVFIIIMLFALGAFYFAIKEESFYG